MTRPQGPPTRFTIGLTDHLEGPVDRPSASIYAEVGELVRLADRLGVGSGSTPEEFALFGRVVTDDAERHARFEQALNTIRDIWEGRSTHRLLPAPRVDLVGRSWLAVNSPASARIAGALGFNVLFSHLRTPEQYRQYAQDYREAGGTGLVAANRPVFVGSDDDAAFEQAEPALRTLWNRFRDEGKIAAATPEPTCIEDLAAHPINFIVGGPETVARQLVELHQQVGFDVANVEVRWAGLPHEWVLDSLGRLMEEVMPRVEAGSEAESEVEVAATPSS